MKERRLGRNDKNTQNYLKKKKSLNELDNPYGVVTYLEPDILECVVKWALGSSKQTELVNVMEFQMSYLTS